MGSSRNGGHIAQKVICPSGYTLAKNSKFRFQKIKNGSEKNLVALSSRSMSGLDGPRKQDHSQFRWAPTNPDALLFPHQRTLPNEAAALHDPEIYFDRQQASARESADIHHPIFFHSPRRAPRQGRSRSDPDHKEYEDHFAEVPHWKDDCLQFHDRVEYRPTDCIECINEIDRSPRVVFYKSPERVNRQ
jgi:hypothetical protein